MKNLVTACLGIFLLILIVSGCQNPFVKNAEIPGNSTDHTDTNTDNGNAVNDSAAAGDPNANDYSNSNSRTISGGVLNGKATSLVKPAYPPAARAVRANGTVNVQVVVDEKGTVVSANAVSGHPLLRASAVAAARQSKFSPTLLNGKPVKLTGVIVYNYTPE
jgi:TonB family protein